MARHIAIVGGGYSGTAAAIHLSRRSGEKLRISIVDRRPPGPGFAHSSEDPEHRLNGPDTIHLLYPEQPEHFAQWMRASGALERDPNATAPTGLVFTRRADFGRYMAAELTVHAARNPSGSEIAVVQEAALDLVPRQGGFDVVLERGGRLRADACILATGWDPAGCPAALSGVKDAPAWINDPWDAARRAAVPRELPALIVGAGLSAADIAVSLLGQGHAAPITCLSRHGLRPASQNPWRTGGSFFDRLVDPMPFVKRHGIPKTMAEVIRAYRADLAALDPQRSSWHVPFDEMRDASIHYWPALPVADRRRFARHLKGFYDAYRFRYPPQTHLAIDRAEASGQLRFLTARLSSARAVGNGLEVVARDANSGKALRFEVGAALNCTGPQLRPSVSSNPLLRTLAHAGTIADAAAGFGIDVDRQCRAISASGRAHANLFVLGPPTAGSLGETTAVPFITKQVLELVPQLLGAAGVRAAAARGA